MRFRATLESHGKIGTGIQVPAEVIATLGAGRRPPVRVTITGHTFRDTIAALGERFIVGVSAANRAAAGVTVGDELDVEIELDAEPRAPTVPRKRDAALDGGPNAQSAFDALSASRPGRVPAVEGTKAEMTRKQRIAQAIEELRTRTG
jgi:hypothetical protein